MPQLDTIYTFTVYIWSWSTLYMITQKTTTFKMVINPSKQQTTHHHDHKHIWTIF